MTARYATSSIFGAFISLIICLPALAADCETLAVPGEKPAMDAYADYSDFLVAIMAFKSRSRDRAEQEILCPELLAAQADSGPLDPTVTYGPETLESAAARAEQLNPSIYRVGKTWYQRSTSRSFALPALATSQMNHQSIGTHIRTLIDGPVPEREQQLVLDSLGPLADDDGQWGPDIAERQLHDDLKNRELAPTIAATIEDLPFSGVQTTHTANNGYIRIYYKAGDIVLVEALAQSCLGFC